jgi:imidazolonepropionase-like amidohydrolase
MYADERKEAALIQSMVDRGTYVVPTFSVMRMMFPEDVPVPFDSAQRHVSKRIRGFWTGVNRIPALSSAADRAFENAFLVHYAYSQPFVRKLDAAGGRIVAGTDEPTPGLVPGFSLHGELELLVRAGLTPMRAIQAATQTAADFLRRSHELGTIQPGKLADIIVVDGQPHVRIDDIRRVRTVVSDGILINPVGILSAAAAR